MKVSTGEEDEEEVFAARSKLFRLVEGEWKERGLGVLKILRHKEKGTHRLVMRREQVLKICANHSLNAGMKMAKVCTCTGVQLLSLLHSAVCLLLHLPECMQTK